jgi:hypothetical protein
MIDPVEFSLAIPQGASRRWRFTLTNPDAISNAPDFTGAVFRLDLRNAASKRGAALLSLSSAGSATAGGSALAASGLGLGTYTLDLHLADEDTAALPYDTECAGDLEVEYPSGDVDRLARITFPTDGEYTHG